MTQKQSIRSPSFKHTPPIVSFIVITKYTLVWNMSMGRGSAVAVVLVLFLVALQYEVAQAAIYTVGGAGGWSFSSGSWPKGKRFRAGDVLGMS